MWQWLMSKNCFLKNGWFWLLFFGIGVAIFFSGGLLLPLAAAVPLLAIAAEKGLLSIRAGWRWVFGSKRRQTAPYVPVSTEEAAVSEPGVGKQDSDPSQAAGVSSRVGEHKELPIQASSARVKRNNQNNYDSQQRAVKSEGQSMKDTAHASTATTLSKQTLTPEQRFYQALYILDWFHRRAYFDSCKQYASENDNSSQGSDLPKNTQLTGAAAAQARLWLSTFSDTLSAMKQQDQDYPRLKNAGMFASPQELQAGWDDVEEAEVTVKGYKWHFKKLNLDYHPDKSPLVKEEMSFSSNQGHVTPVTVAPAQANALYGVVSSLITGFISWLGHVSRREDGKKVVSEILLSKSLDVSAQQSGVIAPERLATYRAEVDALAAKQAEQSAALAEQRAALDKQRADLAALLAKQDEQLARSDARLARSDELLAKGRARLAQSAAERKERAAMNETHRKRWISEACSSNAYPALASLKQRGTLTVEDVVALRDHSDPSLKLSEEELHFLTRNGFFSAPAQDPASSQGSEWYSLFLPKMSSRMFTSSATNQPKQHKKKRVAAMM